MLEIENSVSPGPTPLHKLSCLRSGNPAWETILTSKIMAVCGNRFVLPRSIKSFLITTIPYILLSKELPTQNRLICQNVKNLLSFQFCSLCNMCGQEYQSVLYNQWSSSVAAHDVGFQSICSEMLCQICDGNYNQRCFVCLVGYYRPQTKFAKVMFLHLSVSHSVHMGGHLPQCMLGYADPLPRSRPLGAEIPPPPAVHAGRYGQQAGGTHPTGMHTCCKDPPSFQLKRSLFYNFTTKYTFTRRNIDCMNAMIKNESLVSIVASKSSFFCK